MIVMEILNVVGGRMTRPANSAALILLQPSSLDVLAAHLSSEGSLVTAAPELTVKVLNQGGGRGIKIVSQEANASGGTGAAVDYGLIWVNPVGVKVSPDFPFPSEQKTALFRTSQHRKSDIVVDWDRPGEMTLRYLPLAGAQKPPKITKLRSGRWTKNAMRRGSKGKSTN